MFEKLFTVYSTGQVTLAAAIGATGSANITIEANTSFELHFITGIATQAGLIVTNWGGTVQVNDSGVKTDFFDRPIFFMEVAGDGRQPYPMKYPRLIRANSTIQVSWVNNVATATVVALSLHGYKVDKDKV